MGLVNYEYERRESKARFLNNGIGPSMTQEEIERLNSVIDSITQVVNHFDKILRKEENQRIKKVEGYVLHPQNETKRIIFWVDTALAHDIHSRNNTHNVKERLSSEFERDRRFIVCRSQDDSDMYEIYRQM